MVLAPRGGVPFHASPPPMIRRIPLTIALSLAPLLATVSAAHAQGPALDAFGLAPGGALAELQETVAKAGGKAACRTSPVDPRVSECTATLTRTSDHRTWSMTASLVDGTAGMLVLRTTTDPRGFDALREEWTVRFGRPNLKHMPNLESYQWIRDGRMLKLAGVNIRGRYEVTVSVVEGEVLDRLGGT